MILQSEPAQLPKQKSKGLDTEGPYCMLVGYSSELSLAVQCLATIGLVSSHKDRFQMFQFTCRFSLISIIINTEGRGTGRGEERKKVSWSSKKHKLSPYTRSLYDLVYASGYLLMPQSSYNEVISS